MKKKNILITGSTTGLGLDLFQHLLRKKKYNLICTYRDEHKIKKYKNKGKFIKIDFFNESDLQNISKKLKNLKIDSVVHCAGGGLGYRDNDIEIKKLEELIKLNFYSAFEINKALIKNKPKKKRLNIIHIGSIAAYEPVASIGYSISKSSLISYNKNLALKYFKNSIFCKLLIPGSFDSQKGSMQRLKKRKKSIYKKIQKKMISRKLINSGKLIPVIEFLLTKESDILTGSTISATNLESVSNFL